MQLPDQIYTRIAKQSEAGNRLMEKDEFQKAISHFQDALAELPRPVKQWEAATWLYASIGDAYFSLKDFRQAVSALEDALSSPDGQVNPFIHLRLGEAFFELDDLDRAKEHLLRCYMLEGKKIFRSEPGKYFRFLKNNVKLD